MSDSIIFDYLDTPMGQMIAGVYNNSCVLLEFSDRKSLPSIIQRKQQLLHSSFVQGNHTLINEINSQLTGYFQGTLQEFNIPLTLLGSDFQKEVWSALLKIPYGETTTYGTIAKQLHKPNNSRAVGRANGLNNIAIVIPCHRVIGEDGSLTGYGGGKDRKAKLLELEKTISSGVELMMNEWFD